MSVHATCPKCGEQFRRPDGMAGRLEKCPECKFVFRLPFTSQPALQDMRATEATPSGDHGVRQAGGEATTGDEPVPSPADQADFDLSATDDESSGAAMAVAGVPTPQRASLPQYAPQTRKHASHVGRKLLMAVSVLLLVGVLGTIAVIWASSKLDETSPKKTTKKGRTNTSATPNPGGTPTENAESKGPVEKSGSAKSSSESGVKETQATTPASPATAEANKVATTDKKPAADKTEAKKGD